MLDYYLKDVRILLSALQVAVRGDFSLMGFDGMAECCTIASKTMMFFRHEYLKDNTIGVISQSGIASTSREKVCCGCFCRKATIPVFSMTPTDV